MLSHKSKAYFGKILHSKIFWILLGALIFQGFYLFLTLDLWIGFPLDDAWIHQTYARNLATHLRWEFVPGQLSGGSTSPLWTLLLVPGHWLPSQFFLGWTFLISLCLFVGSGYLFDEITERLTGKRFRLPLFGLLFISEWHLVWAANSGMETILLTFLFLLLIFWIISNQQYSWRFALFCALLIWVRPDAVTFIGVFGLQFLDDLFRKKVAISQCLKLISLFAISILMYGLFNYFVTGSFFPNTFYAKQSEYAALYQTPLLQRIGNILLIPLTGVGALLLPAWIYQVFDWIRNKQIKYLSFVIWMLSFALLYALRLPVTYQHGRYFIPLIPIYLLVGIFGFIHLLAVVKERFFTAIMLSWKISLGIIAFIFLLLGANAYSQDVAIIESEMVSASQWISDNTNSTAIIAAHDIGALGFYSDRQIIDLAGLISPDVIPIISNEERLRHYLDEKNVNYLMTFPDWYTTLQRGKKVVYAGDAPYVIEAGGRHMTVYDWQD